MNSRVNYKHVNVHHRSSYLFDKYPEMPSKMQKDSCLKSGRLNILGVSSKLSYTLFFIEV